MKCKKLDDVFNDKVPHLIKIDTQGSELDILKGSEQILRNYAPLVIAETWTKEIYSKAPCSWSIMKYMDSLGYTIFNYSIAHSDFYDTKNKINHCKANIGGFDFLFVKDFSSLKKSKLSSDDYLILCSLMEFFSFRDYAYYIAKNIKFHKASDIIDKLEENGQLDRRFLVRIAKRFISLINRKLHTQYLVHTPSLHC